MRLKYFHSAKVIDGAETLHFRGKDGNLIEAVRIGRGNKPLVVANHCWAGPSGSVVVPGLTDHYDFLVVANRGMGDSEIGYSTPKTYIADCVSDRATVLKAMGITSFHLLGHSMGGMTSVLFAHIFADQFHIRSLTLFTPVLDDPVHTLPVGPLSAATRLLLGRISETVNASNGVITEEAVSQTTRLLQISRAANFLRTLHRSPEIREVNAEFWKAALMANQHAVATGIQAMREHGLSTWEAFDRLALPTLILTGQYDTLVRAKIAHEASARNPCARGVLVRNTSHFLHLEVPAVILPVILGHTTRFD